jgi:hypothetical protein
VKPDACGKYVANMVGKLIKGEYTIINIMQHIREENRFAFACFVNVPVHLF